MLIRTPFRGPTCPAPTRGVRVVLAVICRTAGLTLALTAISVASLVATPSFAALRTTRVRYIAPVDAPVTDSFRAPTTRYGPQNLGIEYSTASGAAVRAPADGVVAFAGQVGGTLYLVIAHADGVRTTLGGMLAVHVRRDANVTRGDVVGVARDRLHLGARLGETYIDPTLLFDETATRAHLVAGPRLNSSQGIAVNGATDDATSNPRTSTPSAAPMAPTPTSPSPARASGRGSTPDSSGRRGAVGRGRTPAPEARSGNSRAASPAGATTVGASCTPDDAVVGPNPGRRIAVLVAGLDSSIGQGFLDRIDTAALGYANGDVRQFSYRGGYQPYQGDETTQDLTVLGARLRSFIDAVSAAHPDVPIDVIAHSQGGIVARVALTPRPPSRVEHLVTLASPHQGAPAAGFLYELSHTAMRPWMALRDRRHDGFDTLGRSIEQLRPNSALLRDLNARPAPPGVRVTSIVARADPTVPVSAARLPGATNVVVDVDGLSPHRDIVTAESAQRAMQLALGDRDPPCRSRHASMLDAVTGAALHAGQLLATAPAASLHAIVDPGHFRGWLRRTE